MQSTSSGARDEKSELASYSIFVSHKKMSKRERERDRESEKQICMTWGRKDIDSPK